MLNAEKDVLSSALYKARNEIKRLDLDNLYSFLSSLATQAALLAGFAFGALPTAEAGRQQHPKLTPSGSQYTLTIQHGCEKSESTHSATSERWLHRSAEC